MKFLFYTGFLLFAVTLFGDVAIGQADEEAVPALDVIATADMTLEEQMHFKSIASKLRCPTCTGLSVLDSDAAFSVQIQSLVKEQIKEGKSEDEILAYFTQRYGPWILREPPKEGVNLFAWLFPVLLMVCGPLLIWFFVWRRRRAVATAGLRSAEAIVAEFEAAVARARASEQVKG